MESPSQNKLDVPSVGADDFKQTTEALKLAYDFYKHLTTLATGSLVFLCTLLDKFFHAPSWRWLVTAIFAGFAVSVLASLITMFIVASATGSRENLRRMPDTIWFLATVCALGGFIVGVLSLMTFSLRNFGT